MIARRTLLAALTALPLFASAAGATTDTVEIVDGYARATAPGAMAGAAYLTIRSLGPADRITGVSSAAAARTEIHESVETDGMMQMRPVDALDLPAGGEVALAPGGLHVMLIGLTGPLVVGESLALTLQFEHAGAVTVTLPVEPLTAE